MQLMRNPDGTWREPAAVAPTGGTVRIYVSVDKSPKQNNIEASGRRLHRAFQAAGLNQTIHLNRKEGSISVAWKPVAKVLVQSADEVSILWNALAVTELGIDKEAIMAGFADSSRSTAGAQWAL